MKWSFQRSPSRPSLRTRLTWLVLLALLPAIAGVALDALLTRDQILRTAERVIVREAWHAAALEERWLGLQPGATTGRMGPANQPEAGTAWYLPRLAYFDADGRHLAGEYDGTDLARDHIARILKSGAPHSFDMTAKTGATVLVAVAPVRSAGTVQGFVRAEVPRSQVLEVWSGSVMRRVLSGLLAIGAGLLLAWWLLERWIVRDLLALRRYSESVQTDPDAAVPRPGVTREAQAAAQAVVAMAEAFHRQRHTLLQLHAELRDANATLEQRVQERTRELERSERLYRTLAEAIPQIVWYGSAAAGITYVNRAWQECIGPGRDDPLGYRWLEFMHPDERDRAMQDWRVAVESGTPFAGQFRLRTQGGEYRHYLLRSAPLAGSAGGPDQLWVGVGTDVTEMKKSEASLLLANSELQSFTYSVSHDLRAPLIAIKGFSNVLISDFGEGLDPQMRHYLERIAANSQHMSTLIDDLLDLAHLSLMEAHRVAVDFSALCAEVVAAQREATPQRHVEVDIAPQMQACADRRLLRIALTNLIGNAWKFTQGVSAARISMRCIDRDGERVYVISDNGTGFEMRHATRLFGAFQRLHGKEFPGTGIGLATVWRVIRRHGGRIWAEASPGKGASFYFTLGKDGQDG